MKSKLITSLVTPFDKKNKIDEEELKKLINEVYYQGSEGIVVGDTTGEGTSLKIEELIRIIEIVNEENNKIELIINISNNSTDKTIEMIYKVKEYRHDALMVVVPYYNKPTQKGIYEHFKKIANTFKEEKFILSNVPSRTIVKLETNTLLRLVNECSNIIGLKQTSEDFALVKETLEKKPDFIVYSGDDKYTLEMLKLGARGVISTISHVFGKDVKELIDDYSKGIENITLDKYLKELSSILFIETNPIPIKYVLSKRGYKSMNLRLPMTYLEKHKDIDIILNL